MPKRDAEVAARARQQVEQRYSYTFVRDWSDVATTVVIAAVGGGMIGFVLMLVGAAILALMGIVE